MVGHQLTNALALVILLNLRSNSASFSFTLQTCRSNRLDRSNEQWLGTAASARKKQRKKIGREADVWGPREDG